LLLINLQVAKVSKLRKLTGGGPAEPDISSNSSLICAMIPNQMMPVENPWDSDGQPSIVNNEKRDENEKDDEQPIDETKKAVNISGTADYYFSSIKIPLTIYIFILTASKSKFQTAKALLGQKVIYSSNGRGGASY